MMDTDIAAAREASRMAIETLRTCIEAEAGVQGLRGVDGGGEELGLGGVVGGGREVEDLVRCLTADWMGESTELLLMRVSCLAGVFGAVWGMWESNGSGGDDDGGSGGSQQAVVDRSQRFSFLLRHKI